MESFLIKLLKFGLVGFSGVFVDFGVTYLAKEKVALPKYAANSLGFAFAVTSNFLLNRVWTFDSHEPSVGLQYAKFILVASVGVVLSNLIIHLLSEKKIGFYFSKGLATAGVMGWNFLANYLFTFR